jgi:uncharacterized membrane protein HdeD (DUF308 family)
VTQTAQEPADMVGRLGRHWGWLFAYGLLTLIAGIAVLAWPSETLLVLAVLFGIQLIISGIFRLVNGVIEIFTALSHREMPQRGWTVAMGVLSILAGIIVLAYPGLSLYGLAIILGVWLLIFGVMEMAAAFRLRSAVHAAPGMA